MSDEDDLDLQRDLSRALADAYVQTGTQHLDLSMVIKGKRLKEAEQAVTPPQEN